MKHVVSIDDSVILKRIDKYQQLSPADKLAAKDRLLQEFPQIADDLAACLNGLDLMEGVAEEFRGPDGTGQKCESSFTDVEELGDFTIVREVGRGGMGVVYEARQRSLGRRVALKVLPFASFLDPVRLQRFKQEAQAAAILHHPNIVPVHCVGTERGVHFYAMEFIDGRSLAEIISVMRSSEAELASDRDPLEARSLGHVQSVPPSQETTPHAALSTAYSQDRRSFYRQAAQFGAQIADALHYAHQQGIVHRDIKPSNLMVDVRGKPSVTDFGLAQTQDDHGLTMTGDLMGTLRYMSPEQADGRKLLDPRTDVYSLGATLYELITLVPAIDGDNRQQVLSRITEVQMKSPRAVDVAIPKDLEKILLKAMSRDVEDRYESAELFAEDLRRFLNGQSVSARPTGRLQKALRWMNRHRLVSGLVGIVAALLLTFAVLGQFLAAHAQKAQREAADSNAELIDVLSKTLDSITQAVENVPDNEFVTSALITDTIDSFKRLLKQDPDNPQLQFQAARAYEQLSWAAVLRFGMKETEEAEWLRKAEAISESLVRVSPDNAEYQEMLGNVCWRLATCGAVKDTMSYFERCKRILERLLEVDPDNNQYLFYMANTLGSQAVREWDQGDRDTANVLFDEAAKLYEMTIARVPGNDDYRCCHAWILTRRAERMVWTDQRHADAVLMFRKALDLFEQDFSKSLMVTRLRIGRGDLLCKLGVSLSRLGQLEEAEGHLRRSVQELVAVSTGFPQSDWAEHAYKGSRHKLIQNLVAQKRNSEALAEAQLLLAQWGERDSLHKRLNRGDIQYLAGRILWWEGNQQEARKCFQMAADGPLSPESRQHLLSQCPDPAFRRPLEALASEPSERNGEVRFVAGAHIQSGQWQEAINLLSPRANEGRADGFDYLHLAIATHHLGDQPAAKDWYQRGSDRVEQPMSWNEMFYWMELDALSDDASGMLAVALSSGETTRTNNDHLGDVTEE